MPTIKVNINYDDLSYIYPDAKLISVLPRKKKKALKKKISKYLVSIIESKILNDLYETLHDEHRRGDD